MVAQALACEGPEPPTAVRERSAICRIGVDAVAAALSRQMAAMARQVIDQLVPLHTREAPTCTDSGTS